MNISKLFSISIATCVFLLNTQCSSSGSLSSVSWPAKMTLLSVSMGKIMPLANDVQKFTHPDNEEVIKTELKQIYNLAHDLESSEKTPDGDPILKFSASQFSKDMKNSYQQFSLGNKKQALFAVGNMTNYCISCHTRADFGRSDFKKSWSFKFDNFSVFEKVQFHFATRQYTEGLNLLTKSFDQFIKDKNLEVGILNALAVSVRVKGDPQITDKIIENILKSKSPNYIKKRARSWKKSNIAWSLEKSNPPQGRDEKYMRARNLVLKGLKNKDVNLSIIEFLRASNLLHTVLMEGQKDIINADALYLAGIAARPLKNINLWTLHEVYFEKCIYAWPQSELAEKCYQEIEKEWLSETYLAGDKASEELKNKLTQLKDVARRLRKDEIINNINFNSH